VHVAYFLGKQNAMNRTGWMDPKDLSRFTYDGSCQGNASAFETKGFSVRWNACFEEARDTKLDMLRPLWAQEDQIKVKAPAEISAPSPVSTGTPVLADQQANAAKAADAFLQGVRIMDVPEGKKTIAANSWGGTFPVLAIRSLPVFSEATTLYEGMFPSDSEGVEGYKRLIEMKVSSPREIDVILEKRVPPEGQLRVRRYLLIAYKDKSSGTWRIFDLGESVDLEKEIAFARQELTTTTLPEPKYKQRRLGHFLILDGKLMAARAAFQASLQLNSPGDKEDISDNLKQHLAFLDTVAGPREAPPR
jgi:hypothetical protein